MMERTRAAVPRLLADAAYDVFHALRDWRNQPVFFGGIVLTLALALGANASMFGVVSQLLFAPPPGVRQADQVYDVRLAVRTDLGDEFEMGSTSYPVFQALRAVPALGDVAAARSGSATIGTGTERTEVKTVLASGEYFRVLGAAPQLGRFFGPADDAAPAGHPVVVLSHAFWKRHFGADPAVLGQQLLIDNRAFQIVGVARARFSGATLAPVDLFLPLNVGMYNSPPGWRSVLHMNVVSLVVRLDGVSRAAAEQQATRAYANVLAADPDGSTRRIVLHSLVPGTAARATARGRIVLWLAGVTLVVLMTASANVGTLLLLRAARRRRDISVRLALGVARGRLLRQLLAETFLLAAAGGLTGLILSRWISDIIRATLLADVAATGTVTDKSVLLGTALATLVVGLLAALSPMLLVLRCNIADALQAAGARWSAGRSPLRTSLVAMQVALTTVLLAGAGLFVRSLERVQSQDLGFSVSRLTFVALDFLEPLSGFDRDRLHIATRDQLRRIPGVLRASEVQAMPFGSFHVPPIAVPGMSNPPNAGGQLPFLYAATPEFLQMMRVQLRAGRFLTEADRRGTRLVVLINETFAREVWPGEDALGKCIRVGHDPALPPSPVAPPTLPCRQVVGIVRDSRARSLRPVNREASLMQYYIPFEQMPPTMSQDPQHIFGLLVETDRAPDEMAGTLQRVIQRTLAMPVYARVRPYQDLLDPQLRPWRLGATLFTTFSALALLIASVGLFAIISYLAGEQTRAIGVRLALGAAPHAVRRLILGNALRLVLIGLLIGLGAALVLGRYLQGLLFQTSARDPLVLAASVIALLAVTVLAAALPALRAGRVSPLVALRAE